MNNTASIIILVAESDVPTIEEAYGKPYRNDEGSLPYARRMSYQDGHAAVATALAPIIAAKVPIVGDIAPSNYQPGCAFCAVEGEYHEWPQMHGQPCVVLYESRDGRLAVDREDLRQTRKYWVLHRRAMDHIQERYCSLHRSANHDHA